MNQLIIVQGQLALVVKTYTELGNSLIVEGENIIKVLSAPDVYLKPKRVKLVGSYAIIEQREKGG